MQSSPTEHSQKPSTAEPASDNKPTKTQHGLQQVQHPDSQEAELANISVAALESYDESENPDSVTSNASLAEEYGLNTPTSQSSKPGTKVYEYESALTPLSRRSSDGPTFEVSSAPLSATRSPIADLPNELLTHALSHLPAHELHAVALVSRRFHSIVRSPHSWRAAFARFFPSSTRLAPHATAATANEDNSVASDKRVFTRLSAFATWQREYTLRSRLLRSVQRGKPVQQTNTTWRAHAEISRSGTSLATSPTVLWESQCFGLVQHLHGVFEYDTSKRYPHFIHGADDVGISTMSDPQNLTDRWGVAVPPPFIQFADTHPGDALWGLGSGEVIGNENVMDVSQPYGVVYGSGSPGAFVYFRATTEQRGRLLPVTQGLSIPENGVPRVLAAKDGVSAIWIAKDRAIPSLSDGLVGILSGHHSGMVTAYSLGASDLRDSRTKPGEVTARWMLSPGVPIVAVVVDEHYSLKRQAQNRIWAVALNALGELFYLTKFPKRNSSEYLPLRSAGIDEPAFDRLAWVSGRTVQWMQVELSRRIARPDPYNEYVTDGSYSPRSSWNGACLSKAQLQAETRELEEFLDKKPKDFRKVCYGWDMRRKLLVDFAGDDGNLAGEAFVVIGCGLDEDTSAYITRYTRLRVQEEEKETSFVETAGANDMDYDKTPIMEKSSMFGPAPTFALRHRPLPRDRRASERSFTSNEGSPTRRAAFEEWRQTSFSFSNMRNVRVTAVTIDESKYATLTISEDPSMTAGASSTTSTPLGSPVPGAFQVSTDIPGHRGRFISVGTKTGSIFVWDVRAAVSTAIDLVNTVEPLAIIHTDSPEISCIGLTALQLVHGGNDGLVQVWDPLGSAGNQPLRTLNSRFSSRARRRLAQAQASAQGVGINLFAAGAILLDPDPTTLRGIVSLGSQLKYWAFSSSATDALKGSKRRLRRGERGSNAQSDRFAATVRNANLKGYIASERAELEWEKKQREQQRQHKANRFGTDLLQSEEEALAYARMLSEESMVEDEVRRSSQVSTPALGQGSWTSQTPARDIPRSLPKSTDDFDAELAEAIARSLDESSEATPYSAASPFFSADSPTPLSAYEVPIRFASGRRGRRSPRNTSPKDTGSPSPTARATGQFSQEQELSDLEFALQLSLAEEESRKGGGGGGDEDGAEEFPILRKGSKDSGRGKGKGRARG